MNKTDVKYNKVSYKTGPQSFASIVDDKLENVHRMLLNDALRKYFEDNKESKYDNIEFANFVKTYNIVEQRNQTYDLPSVVIITKNTFPYSRESVDLTQYWNKYEFAENNKDIIELIEDEEIVKDAKLVYIDYVRNRCKFRSKINNKEFWTTLDYINEDTLTDDEMTLKGTFGELLKNI